MFFKIIRKTSRNDPNFFLDENHEDFYQQASRKFSMYFRQLAGKLLTYQVTSGKNSINRKLCKIFSTNFLVYPANLSMKYSLLQITNLRNEVLGQLMPHQISDQISCLH